MSDSPKNLHDPTEEAHQEKPDHENGDGHSSPEISSLNSSAILVNPDDFKAEQQGEKDAKDDNRGAAGARAPAFIPVSISAPPPSTDVVDLNKTMPWKLLYPIASRETIISLCKATAINFILPFINGVFLGFGEICAHELAYRWGWVDSARIVNAPGRRLPPNAGNVGLRATGPASSGRSGIGSGLLSLDEDREFGSS
ncbi:outer membrane protein TOM13-domain-containing protein [Mortierella sp. GBAus27b]|nr:hypothetical protein BGX31_007806 [Mortierella sp. GBA43]KAI8347257.1 outer membrane protein TOM13-domain-containing protein [Mortierella sp. GBAus27b]